MNFENSITWFALVALIGGTYFYLTLLRKVDKFDPEPLHALMYVLVIGGIGSVFFAILGNQLLESFSRVSLSGLVKDEIGQTSNLDIISVFLFSAFNEELCKYTFAFWLIRKSKHVNEPLDGLIYAITIGLGFSFFENITYFLQFGAEVVFSRMLLAVPLHMAAAAIWGVYLSTTLAKQKSLVFVNALPMLLLAALFHGLWNASTTIMGGGFILLAPFVLRFCVKRVKVVIEELHLQSPFNPERIQ